MTAARRVLYSHCLVAFACIGLTRVALDRQWKLGGPFQQRLEEFFAQPAVKVAYLTCLGSCLAFPVALAYCTVGRLSAWRWTPAVAAVIVLALVQYVALVLVLPVRY